MIEQPKQNLSLDRPTTYQIKIPGHLETSWSDWTEDMAVTADTDHHGLPVTTLTGSLDQAALQGLLRRLYSLGLPLISVIWIGDN